MAAKSSDSLATVLDAIEAKRREIRESASATIREVEAERDDELGRLDRAVAALYGAEVKPLPAETSPPAAQPSSKPKRRRRGGSAGSAAAVRERREKVFRFLVEEGKPIAREQISRALKISAYATRTALQRLCEEGKVARTGAHAATRYQARVKKSAAGPTLPLSAPPQEGTLEGRVLAMIQDRGSPYLDELPQATGASLEQIRNVCGALVREEEIHMSQRNGRPICVSRRDA
jgi:hypothetical protein